MPWPSQVVTPVLPGFERLRRLGWECRRCPTAQAWGRRSCGPPRDRPHPPQDHRWPRRDSRCRWRGCARAWRNAVRYSASASSLKADKSFDFVQLAMRVVEIADGIRLDQHFGQGIGLGEEQPVIGLHRQLHGEIVPHRISRHDVEHGEAGDGRPDGRAPCDRPTRAPRSWPTTAKRSWPSARIRPSRSCAIARFE